MQPNCYMRYGGFKIMALCHQPDRVRLSITAWFGDEIVSGIEGRSPCVDWWTATLSESDPGACGMTCIRTTVCCILKQNEIGGELV